MATFPPARAKNRGKVAHSANQPGVGQQPSM